MIEIDKITDLKNYLSETNAIIFDLDDTLFSEKEYMQSGYNAVAETIPQIKNAAQKFWNAYQNGVPVFDTVLKREGIYSEELKQKCLYVYRFHQPNINLYDGVRDMLEEFMNIGYKLAIITDGRPEGQWAKIRALDIEKYMEKIIVTDELGGTEYRKPSEKAFKIMQKTLDLPFSAMCYVGDNIRKDFVAPEKLGMKSIWFKNKNGLYI